MSAQLPAGTRTSDVHGDAVLTLCRIKPIPGVTCIIKAVIKATRHSKHLCLTLQMQVCPSPASQRKSTWEPSQQPSILLGTAQRSITSYKVYSTASAQVEEQRKSLLKMLRAAIKQPPPRTQAPPAHGRWKSRPGGHAAREHDSARPLFLHLGSAAEPQAVSKSGAGSRLQSELTLAAGKGRD